MERGLELGCLIAMRECQSRRGQKFSKSKNFSTFFKTCLLHVSGLWDNFKRKKFFSEFHTNPSLAGLRGSSLRFPPIPRLCFNNKAWGLHAPGNPSPGIVMRFERQKLPLLVIREGRLSLFGSYGKGTGPWVSHCIAMRECQTPVEVKNFFKKFFNFFSKHVCSTFQDSGIILSGKNFFPTFRPI